MCYSYSNFYSYSFVAHVKVQQMRFPTINRFDRSESEPLLFGELLFHRKMPLAFTMQSNRIIDGITRLH